MAWPLKNARMEALLRPFNGSLDTFLRKPLDDRKFIIRTVFCWLDLYFSPNLAPVDYRLRAEILTTRQKLRLEEKIMRFVISAILNQDYNQVAKPDSTDWFTYACVRGSD